jgi:pilus assembly protein CpaE
VVGAHDLEVAAIRRQLDGTAELQATLTEPDHALAVVRERRPDVVVLFLDHQPDLILAVARKLAAEGTAAVVVSRDRDPDNILLAMRSGARDFAYLEGEEADVRRAVSALAVGVAAAPSRRGTVVAVFGCKGGTGATTIATNLAGALLGGGADTHKVALVDLDTQMGDVLVFLDLTARTSWGELLKNLPRLDDELLHRTLTAHGSGLRVLAQAASPEEAEQISPAGIARTIELLRKHYDFVVIDGIRDFGEAALVALDAADRVVLTMTQDVPSLKNAARALGVLRRLGYHADKLKLVVNRYARKARLDLDAIADALGIKVDATVDNDFPTVLRAIDDGVLVEVAAPRSDVAGDLRGLVPALGLGPAAPRKRGWFRRRS